MNPELKRYELFGWDYEIRNPLSDDEVSWYLKYAVNIGGPILELACGTGRLLSIIAENGFDIDGIDLSQAMLKNASKRLRALPSEVQSRIRLHHKDITDFSLDRRFGLILIADGSFSVLATKEQQISCLRHVYNHLRADGIFLISVRRFDPSQFTTKKQILDWSEPIHHPETNEIVKR